MISFREYLIESQERGGLTIFDIDDTLFHTTAQVKVIRDGKVVNKLDTSGYNRYQLKQGESYDFSEFRDAKKFFEESKPIKRMMEKAKIILRNTLNKPTSRVIIITARTNFDNKEMFLNTFRKHGIDIDKVRVERAGNIKDIFGTANQKMIIIRSYLNTGQFARVRLFDDSRENLKVFLSLQKEFPDIRFEAYYAMPDGSVKTVR